MGLIEDLFKRLTEDGYTFEDIVIGIEKNLTTADQRESLRKLGLAEQRRQIIMINAQMENRLGARFGRCEMKGRRHSEAHAETPNCINWKRLVSMNLLEVPPDPFAKEEAE